MASTKKIELVITSRVSGANGASSSKKTPSKNVNAVSEFFGNLRDNWDDKLQVVGISANQAYNYGKQAINGIASNAIYFVNRQMYLEDDYKGQRNLNIAVSMVSKATNVIGSVASAFIASGGNPVVVGIALAGQLVNIGLDVYKNLSEQQIKIDQQNYQLDFSRVRAGYSITAGSIGEDK